VFSKIAIGFIGLILAGMAVFIPSIPFEIINANALSNKAAYGYVDVPGSTVLHLPAGNINVEFAEFVPGAGNQTPDVYWPSDMTLSVTPSGGGATAPALTKSIGTSTKESAYNTNAGIDFYKLQVSDAGRYKLTAHGSTDGQNINAKFLFGYGPPVPPLLIYAIVALIELGGLGMWLLFKRSRGESAMPNRIRGKAAAAPAPAPVTPQPHRQQPKPAVPTRLTPPPQHQLKPRTAPKAAASNGKADPLDRLQKLADLHDRGVLTDAEFDAEKSKILAED
jgi:hypothetical protein